MTELNMLGPDSITFEPAEQGRLNCRLKDGSLIEDVHCVMLFPFSDPDGFISVVAREEGEVKEVGVVAKVSDLSDDQAELLRAAVDNRYFFPEITEVRKITHEYGLHEWDVSTDRGDKSFFVHEVKDNISVDDKGMIIICDIEKCRYKITDLSALPAPSQVQVERILL